MEILERRETPAVALGLGAASADVGRSIAIDGAGNVVVTGGFQGTVDFDPGAGVRNLTGSGSEDIYVAKYSSSGALLWAQQIGAGVTDRGHGIAVDAADNIWITGRFSGIVDFDPGAGTANLTSPGAGCFVAKFDSNGNYLWAGQFGGATGWALTLDGSNNVCVTGFFSGTTDFDPGAGTFNVTSAGSTDAFFAKLDNTGNFVAAGAMGGPDLDNFYGGAIAVDATGNMYITGSFDNTADFDPGAGVFNLTTPTVNFLDMFVVKLDPTGNFVWAGQMGGNGDDGGYGVALDASANVYLTGDFGSAPADFDPGAGVFNLNTTGSWDIAVVKLDTNGNFQWARQMGGAAGDHPLGLSLDATGNVYTIGQYQVTVDFDPGAAVFNLTDPGAGSVFVSQLDNAGNFVGAWSLGGASADQGNAIAVRGTTVWTTGFFGGTGDFDPTAGTLNLTSNGGSDIFIASLSHNVLLTETGGATNLIEGSATDTYTVVLDAAPSANVVVSLVPDSQALLSTALMTFTPANWNAAQTVTITSLDDSVIEGDHTSVISHTSSSADTAFNGLTATLTANILDNDPSSLLPFRTVTLNGDYQAAGVGLRGQTSGTINVTGIPAGSTVTQAYLYWDMLNDAQTAALGNVTLAGTPVTGTLIGTAPISVRNGYAYRADVTALVTGNGAYLVAGVASGGMIFAEGASLVVIYANAALPSRTIVLIDGNDLAYLGSLVATNTITGFTAPARVNAKTTFIVGDGNTFAADSGSITGSLGTLNLTDTFDSTDGGIWDTDTYNVSSLIAAGDTTLTTTVNYVNPELLIWVAQAFSIGLPSITVAPTGGSTDVSEAGLADIFTVVLANQPSANVIITLAPDTQVAVNATTLTFTPANWGTAQTLTVTAVNDANVEGPHTGLITQTVTSADAGYNGLPLATLTANIADNDGGVTITQSGGSTSVAEGGATDTYTVVLQSSPAANVIVTLNVPASLTAAPSPLTFTSANWNVAQTVTVAAVDDVTFQGPRTGVITHTASSGDPLYNAIGIANVTANIADNDAVPGITINQPTTSLQEGAATSYSIVLQTQPAASVTINLAPDAQVNAAPSTLLFTTANWNIPQTVNITTIDDTIPETSQTGTLTHTVSSADAAYNALAIPAVTVQIVDNDGTLVVGSERDDRILVNFVGGKVQAIVNGKASWLSGPIVQVLVLAQGGNDYVQITAPTVPVLVQGGAGNDAVWVLGSAGYNTFVLDAVSVAINNRTVSIDEAESFVLGGRTSNDTFRILNLPAIATELKGDRGNDSVLAADTVNDWRITSASGGSLNGTLTLNGIENWLGGTDDDAFTFADKKTVAGKIDGGGGNDSLDYAAYTVPVNINLQANTATGTKSFANITSIRGGLMSDKLIGANQSNFWSLADNNLGDVNGILFERFENLTGGKLDDTFALADGIGVSGKIDGGGGVDVLDYSGYSTPITIHLQAKTATGLGGALNFEQFLGGSSGEDTLTASNAINKWLFTASGAGTLNTLIFSEFENFTGGANTDTFTVAANLAEWLGVLSGGAGKDTLNSFTAGINIWTNGAVGAGTLNGRAFAGIELRR